MSGRKLNQTLAVEKGVKTRVTAVISDVYKQAQKPGLFNGFSKSYSPRDDEGDPLPPEMKRVEVTADILLSQVAECLSELFDVTASKDAANCVACADVIVDGQTILSKVPPPTLIFLEKQLVDLRTLVDTLPGLDPAEAWQRDAQDGLYRSNVVRTTRTQKVPTPVVLLQPTEHHPGQAELVTKDVIVGDWVMIKASGAMAPKQKQALLARVDQLLRAVKVAREEANSAPAPHVPIAQKVFDFLLPA